MAYISFNNLWKSEFDRILSIRDEVQVMNINQSKLEVHDTFKKEDNLATNFTPVNDSDVIKKLI